MIKQESNIQFPNFIVTTTATAFEFFNILIYFIPHLFNLVKKYLQISQWYKNYRKMSSNSKYLVFNKTRSYNLQFHEIKFKSHES